MGCRFCCSAHYKKIGTFALQVQGQYVCGESFQTVSSSSLPCGPTDVPIRPLSPPHRIDRGNKKRKNEYRILEAMPPLCGGGIGRIGKCL
jgi:hypothetical protein